MSTRAHHDRLDQDFEQLLDQVEFQAVETELTPEKRRARRKLADRDDREFCRIYFPGIFDSPFNPVHNHIAGLSQGVHPITAFRFAGKSAFAYVGKVIKRMCLGNGGLIRLGLRNQTKAEARAAALIRLIKRNRVLLYDYDVTIDQERAEWYIVNDTHLVPVSYRTGLRSVQDDDFKRFRLFVADDLYDRTSVTSEKDNERVVEFVADEVKGQMERDGLCLVFGNPITADAPIETLQKKFPENAYRLPALDDEGRSNWPERYTEADWAEIKAGEDWEVWMGQYMLKPAVRGEVFQPEWIRVVNVNLIQILASVTAIDPSHGTSAAACYKGMMTVGATSSEEGVVLDAYVRKEGYDDVFGYVDALRSRFSDHWKALLFEEDFAQWTLAEKDYRDWSARTGKKLPIIPHLSKAEGAKDTRILTLDHPHRRGKLRYSMDVTPDGEEGTEDFKLFRTQLLAFGAGKEKLDGPDALATAWIMVFRYLNKGTFTPSAGSRRKRGRPKLLGWLR